MPRICVPGDFNFPAINWLEPNVPTTRKEREFYDVVQDFSLQQHNFSVSHISGNTLDLVLSNFPEAMSDVSASTCLVESDHLLLDFLIHIKPAKKVKLPQYVYNFKKAD